MNMTNWISVKERLPRDGQEVTAWLSDTKRQVITDYRAKYPWGKHVTHWAELLEPPKLESSFEQWWSERTPMADSVSYRSVALQSVHRESAKIIWNAAIAASKSPDFVP